MNIVVFGSGRFYDNRKEKFDKHHVVAFLDNDKKKQGKYKDNIIVLNPQKILELEYDCIVLTNQFAQQMKEQLLSYGVNEEKIYSYQEFEEYVADDFYEIKLYGWKAEQETGKRILLLSHELSLTGAPMVVFQLAKMLKELNYQVTVGSMKDGALRREILAEQIPIIICQNMQAVNKYFYNMLEEYDLVLANTVLHSGLINAMYKKNKPVIWWLHDIIDKQMAEGQYFVKGISDNISVYAGGKLVRDAYIESYGRNNIETLLYGVEDEKNSNYQKRKNEKVKFALIASIQPRKGQDVFIDAIKMLPENLKKRAEFWIIGKKTNLQVQEYYDKLKSDTKKISGVRWIGEVDTVALWKLYEEIDVVVAPSRKDPMPVVVTNGFMLDKVCIVSDMTGQAEFVTDGEDGFVVSEGDAAELSQKMSWLIMNQDQIEIMGAKARKLYEREFSMDVFERKIVKIIENRITKI